MEMDVKEVIAELRELPKQGSVTIHMPYVQKLLDYIHELENHQLRTG